MKLNEVHRILKFKQSDWLKRYFGFNADKKKYCQQFRREEKKILKGLEEKK